MKEEEINVFVNGVVHYFETMAVVPAEVSSPYLIDGLTGSIMEYTGVIGITGEYQGNVLFTAPVEMMAKLLALYDNQEASVGALLDLVGEIANTFSGNVREEFGADFQISPPLVAHGSPKEVRTAEGLQTYCIPILWLGMRANLIVALR